MKLTSKDVELFKALSKSDLGKELVNYLNRLSDYICDIRSMKPEDTKESVIKASEMIKLHITNKITKINSFKENELGPFE